MRTGADDRQPERTATSYPQRRRRFGVKGELLLALLPTVTVLLVLAAVEALTRQRLLFASLAASAFLIYYDPEHELSSVRTLVIAQLSGAILGLLFFLWLGPGYLSAGCAMVAAILLMVIADAMHPPAIATALSFGLRANHESNLLLFGMAVGILVVLILLQRAALYLFKRLA